jgi:hypothetical protein
MTDLHKKVDDPTILAGNIMFHTTRNYSRLGYYAELSFPEVFDLVMDQNFESLLDFCKYAERDIEIREGFLSEVAR